MKLFESFNVKNLTFKNRLAMPPMCTYTADTDGMVKDRHLAHYAARAAGGTALIIDEATGVIPNGRINDHCLGIWDEGQIDGLRSLTDICHAEGALVALQLHHAGRKCTARPEGHDYTMAPRALAIDETYRITREMTAEDKEEVKAAFCEAARRAHAAGLDAIEIHAAHGFLLHSILSSVTNKRRDGYGGSLENRSRYLLEVLEAVRAVWPAEKALLLRLSATDYLPGGISLEETVWLVKQAKTFIDIAHITSGGIAPESIHVFPGYQIPMAEAVKKNCQLPVITVGGIREADMVEEILGNKRADLVAMGKELLRNPYWVALTAWERGHDIAWPDLSRRAFEK